MAVREPSAGEPIRRLPSDTAADPTTGTALCLSGGGYRAMLFHVGVLWRLNEAGWLPRLGRVSSVSGGSITAAALARAWPDLDFDAAGRSPRFVELVVAPLLRLAEETLDVHAVERGLLSPFDTIAGRIAAAYRKHLLGGLTLADLPASPSFVFNATNLETGNLFRFSRDGVADWQLGALDAGALPVATAVACSSAFPPVLSPFVLDLDAVGLDGKTWSAPLAPDDGATADPQTAALTDAGFRREITLTDGGVYDNLGLEAAWKDYRTVLVSDAGGQMAAQADPPRDWARQTLRVLSVIDHQVRALRKQQVISSLADGRRDGLYLGIRSDPANYGVPDTIPVAGAVRAELAKVATRLAPPGGSDTPRLINWGYALCDTGLRKHLDPTAAKGSLPYPDAPLT